MGSRRVKLYNGYILFQWLSEHRFMDRMADLHFDEVDNTADNETDEQKQMRKVQGEIDLLKKVASESIEKVQFVLDCL